MVAAVLAIIAVLAVLALAAVGQIRGPGRGSALADRGAAAVPERWRGVARRGQRALGRAARRSRAACAAHPLAVTGGLAGLFVAAAAYRLFAPLPAGTWPHLGDALIFEYVGWYVAEGNRLYVDVWEIKPPLSFEITSLLALLAGENVVAYHVLNVLATALAAVIGAAAAAGIVQELTGDALAAVVAGLATFTFRYYPYRILLGFKAKYFLVATGLGCLYLAYRRRPGLAGGAGAASVGLWQFGAVFPLAGLGLAWQTDRRRGLGRFLLGAALAIAVVLAPIVAWGAVPAMVAETVLAPLLIGGRQTVLERIALATRLLGRALPIAVIGLAGIATSLGPGRRRREWPIVLAAGWFLGQVVFLDMDNYPDLFPLMAVLSIGVGLALASRPAGAAEVDGAEPAAAARSLGPRVIAVAVVLLAAVSAGTLGAYGTGSSHLQHPPTYDTDTELDPEFEGAKTYNATENQYVYWNRVEIPTCRALGAFSQYRLVTAIGLAEDRRWYEAPCGQFGPTWDAVREQYPP